MDKPYEHPASDEGCLSIDDTLEERKVRVLRLDGVGIVTDNRVVREAPQEHGITIGRCVLERPDAQMARGNSGEHRAGQHGAPLDLLAGRHHGQRPRGADAERVHRLAHQVLAQHWAHGCLAVTTPRERCCAEPFKCKSRRPPDTSNTSPSSSARPSPRRGEKTTELVACVRLRHRCRPVGSGIADQHGDTVRRSQRIRIDPQLCGQFLVEHQQPGRRHRCCPPRFVQAPQFTDKGIVELEELADRDAHGNKATRAVAVRPALGLPDAHCDVCVTGFSYPLTTRSARGRY